MEPLWEYTMIQPLWNSLCACAKLLQLCSALFDSMDCSLPGSSVQEILQARILEWAAFSSPGDLPDPGIEPWINSQIN